MGRTISLTIVEEGVTAIADLLEEQAPETCGLIWDRLPAESRMVHGMYSGPELFIVLDDPPNFVPENRVHRVLPGDVGYWQIGAGAYASVPDEIGELVLIYDRGAAIMGPDGLPSWVSLFARMRLPQAEPFLVAARRARWEGPWHLRVERGDDG